VAGYTVRFHTNLGDIDVNLTPDVTPLTVANFLAYLNKGATTTLFSIALFPASLFKAADISW
jgi:cyclophilin family peptidyl-prolyl cis-trans isomerase